MLRGEVEKLRDVALVRACSVRRGVAIQPKVLEEVASCSHDAAVQYAVPMRSTLRSMRLQCAALATWPSCVRPSSTGGLTSAVRRRHDAERDVRRLVVRAGPRARRSTPARRSPSSAAATRGSSPRARAAALRPAIRSRRRRLDVSLDAGDLAGEEQIRSLPRLPRLSQHASGR